MRVRTLMVGIVVVAAATAGLASAIDGIPERPDVGAAQTATTEPDATTTTTEPDRRPLLSGFDFVSVTEGFAYTCSPRCATWFTGDAGATWEERGRLPDDVRRIDAETTSDFTVAFADSDHGYFAASGADNVLHITNDGGRTWERTPPTAEGAYLADIRRISLHRGRVIVVGACEEAPTCSYAATSELGSDTWQWATVPGPASTATRPTDGERTARLRFMAGTPRDGLVWLEPTVPCRDSHGNPGDVVALDAGNIWMICPGEPAGPYGAIEIHASSDGGTTWRVVGSNGALDLPTIGSVPGTRFRMSVAPTGVLWASGYLGWLARSTDGGTTWVPVDYPGGDGPARLDWVDERVGFASSSGVIMQTTDGGDTWEQTGEYRW